MIKSFFSLKQLNVSSENSLIFFVVEGVLSPMTDARINYTCVKVSKRSVLNTV